MSCFGWCKKAPNSPTNDTIESGSSVELAPAARGKDISRKTLTSSNVGQSLPRISSKPSLYVHVGENSFVGVNTRHTTPRNDGEASVGNSNSHTDSDVATEIESNYAMVGNQKSHAGSIEDREVDELQVEEEFVCDDIPAFAVEHPETYTTPSMPFIVERVDAFDDTREAAASLPKPKPKELSKNDILHLDRNRSSSGQLHNGNQVDGNLKTETSDKKLNMGVFEMLSQMGKPVLHNRSSADIAYEPNRADVRGLGQSTDSSRIATPVMLSLPVSRIPTGTSTPRATMTSSAIMPHYNSATNTGAPLMRKEYLPEDRIFDPDFDDDTLLEDEVVLVMSPELREMRPGESLADEYSDEDELLADTIGVRDRYDANIESNHAPQPNINLPNMRAFHTAPKGGGVVIASLPISRPVSRPPSRPPSRPASPKTILSTLPRDISFPSIQAGATNTAKETESNADTSVIPNRPTHRRRPTVTVPTKFRVNEHAAAAAAAAAAAQVEAVAAQNAHRLDPSDATAKASEEAVRKAEEATKIASELQPKRTQGGNRKMSVTNRENITGSKPLQDIPKVFKLHAESDNTDEEEDEDEEEDDEPLVVTSPQFFFKKDAGTISAAQTPTSKRQAFRLDDVQLKFAAIKFDNSSDDTSKKVDLSRMMDTSREYVVADALPITRDRKLSVTTALRRQFMTPQPSVRRSRIPKHFTFSREDIEASEMGLTRKQYRLWKAKSSEPLPRNNAVLEVRAEDGRTKEVLMPLPQRAQRR